MTLAGLQPARADRIFGTGTYDVQYYDPGTNEYIYGTGYFELANHQVADFEFSMLSLTWTEEDIVGPGGRRCDCQGQIRTSMTYPSRSKIIRLNFVDEQGAGDLLWDFREDVAVWRTCVRTFNVIDEGNRQVLGIEVATSIPCLRLIRVSSS